MWQPWLCIHNGHSQYEVEKGPIYSLYSPVQNKAVTIEQYLPESEAVEISAMVNTFGEGLIEMPINYLRISCALSEQASDIASRIIEKWIDHVTNASDMQLFIDVILTELIPTVDE